MLTCTVANFFLSVTDKLLALDRGICRRKPVQEIL